MVGLQINLKLSGVCQGYEQLFVTISRYNPTPESLQSQPEPAPESTYDRPAPMILGGYVSFVPDIISIFDYLIGFYIRFRQLTQSRAKKASPDLVSDVCIPQKGWEQLSRTEVRD
jgi:hypothetical protein